MTYLYRIRSVYGLIIRQSLFIMKKKKGLQLNEDNSFAFTDILILNVLFCYKYFINEDGIEDVLKGFESREENIEHGVHDGFLEFYVISVPSLLVLDLALFFLHVQTS